MKKLTPDQQRIALLAAVLLLIIGAIMILNDTQTGIFRTAEIMSGEKTEIIAQKAKQYLRAREIVQPAGFINTDGGTVTVEEYIGEKVILIDFWTYSCINCQRTQPYLNAWYEKYKDDGLIILGVHTPEFEFEKEYDNVQRAVSAAGIEYPAILDNDYGTWAAYQNRYWPRKYLIDIDGFIVYDHIGEGSYEKTERKIQELLAERADRLGEVSEIEKDIVRPEDVEAVDTRNPRTPEIYFGAHRNAEYLGSGRRGVVGEQTFSKPDMFLADTLYIGGTWDIREEYARSVSGARILLPYQAQKVFMVARSEAGARVRVYLDGEDVTSAFAGQHLREDGTLFVQDEQLYRIIEAPEYGDHVLELIIEEGVLDAFSFTFG